MEQQIEGRNLDLDQNLGQDFQIRRSQVEAIKVRLPEDHRPYTDKYFLRTAEILKAEGLNPIVRAQVFIRKGPGTIHGIEEAVAIIDKYSDFIKNGGRIYSLKEGSSYEAGDTVMVLEGRVQDIVELETMYLGVIAAETTKINDGVDRVNLDQVEKSTKAIIEMIGGRSLLYFGARHWHYSEDADIADAAYKGGAGSAATDIGAARRGQLGVGTIPHALENIYAAVHGKDRAVVEATLAFDRVIDPSVPRIALIDYNNHEVEDSIATADALKGRLHGVRVDTCGENIAQGAFASEELVPENHPLKEFIKYIPEEDKKFWFGNGVSISGVFALRKALDDAGHKDVRIFLSSGFGKIEKVKAFLRAEALLQTKLFDSLGVGSLYKPCRTTTMDIVAVADSLEGLDDSPMSKVGRAYRPNARLKLALGE
ncbi:MAG: hypothetical protein KDD56_07060 [Bdellovibrionales bacterium]|nr:hypothetical protein [Bdellovibrionales bacterium]